MREETFWGKGGSEDGFGCMDAGSWGDSDGDCDCGGGDAVAADLIATMQTAKIMMTLPFVAKMKGDTEAVASMDTDVA